MTIEAWHKRHAIQAVAALPEDSADALIVLELATKLVQSFLLDNQPPIINLDRERGTVISLSSASKGNSR